MWQFMCLCVCKYSVHMYKNCHLIFKMFNIAVYQSVFPFTHDMQIEPDVTAVPPGSEHVLPPRDAVSCCPPLCELAFAPKT